jgi:hypothetical protein
MSPPNAPLVSKATLAAPADGKPETKVSVTPGARTLMIEPLLRLHTYGMVPNAPPGPTVTPRRSLGSDSQSSKTKPSSWTTGSAQAVEIPSSAAKLNRIRIIIALLLTYWVFGFVDLSFITVPPLVELETYSLPSQRELRVCDRMKWFSDFTHEGRSKRLSLV